MRSIKLKPPLLPGMNKSEMTKLIEPPLRISKALLPSLAMLICVSTKRSNSVALSPAQTKSWSSIMSI